MLKAAAIPQQGDLWPYAESTFSLWKECGRRIQAQPNKIFSRMVIGSSTVDLLWILPAKQKAQTKGAVLGILDNQVILIADIFRGGL